MSTPALSAVPINLPRLGVAMTEGLLQQWLVEEGAIVAAGTPLYVIETEKVENEIEAPVPGVVHLLAEAGTTYPVGTCIAEINPVSS